jgi:membrane protein implicated in regulation of membrane protease activity
MAQDPGPTHGYRPLIFRVSLRRLIILLTGLALAFSLVIAILFGEPALRTPHLVLALGFGGVFGAAVLLFIVATVMDKDLWLAALNAGLDKLVGYRPSLVGPDALVGRTALVVSAFTISADGRPVGRVQLGAETWSAQLESRAMPPPAVGTPVEIVELRGMTVIVRIRV